VVVTKERACECHVDLKAPRKWMSCKQPNGTGSVIDNPGYAGAADLYAGGINTVIEYTTDV